MDEGALEHSLAFAGMGKNFVSSMYKNGTTKPCEEKARVVRFFIDMIRADPHTKTSTRIWPKWQKYLGTLQARL
jgi:hypothetical protein